jgi:hypothetical protein
MNVFVLAILFYLLYRFIGGFLIPLFRTTVHMRRQFHDMNSTTGNQPGNPPNPGNGSAEPNGKTNAPGSTSSKVGEYIDFEEVK